MNKQEVVHHLWVKSTPLLLRGVARMPILSEWRFWSDYDCDLEAHNDALSCACKSQIRSLSNEISVFGLHIVFSISV